MFIFLTFKSDVFLTKDNLLNLLYSNSAVGIAACAVTLVVIGGNFDLSLGGDLHPQRAPRRLGGGALEHLARVSRRARGRRHDGADQRASRHQAPRQRLPRDPRLGSRLLRRRQGGQRRTADHAGRVRLGHRTAARRSHLDVPRPEPARRPGRCAVPGALLRRRRDRGPDRPRTDGLRPPRLRGRRQPRGGEAVRPQGRPGRDHHLHHRRLRGRPRRAARLLGAGIRVPRRPDQPGASRSSPSPRSPSAARASSAASAPSGAP